MLTIAVLSFIRWFWYYKSLVSRCDVPKISLLTANVDFDFAEVEYRIELVQLYDEVSARRHARGTRQIDDGCVADNTRILSTHVVVPHAGRRNCR